MKNKKNLYLLLPAVLLIWGLVGYQIFSTIHPAKTSTPTTITLKKPQAPTQKTANFTINTNYRDPFLGKIPPQKKTKTHTKKTIQNTPTTPFPKIIYKGLVSRKSGNHQIFLITIDGQHYFFKKRATHAKVKLIRGNNKKITLQFQGKQQTVAITK